jgi:hypothetical protein
MTDLAVSRRDALALAGYACAGGLAFSASSTLAASVDCPTGALTLSRILERGLRDGRSIIVTRRWRVVFTPQSRGIAVSGEQTSVEVKAPPALAQLSEIERTRSTASLFPILLSPEGRIVAAGEMTTRDSLDKAITTAERLLADRGMAPETASDANLFFASLQQAGSSMLDEMPGDLFFPSTQPVRQTREVPLPDGTVGAIDLSWEASVQPGKRLLASARREVTTRLGETALKSSEEWRLAPV